MKSGELTPKNRLSVRVAETLFLRQLDDAEYMYGSHRIEYVNIIHYMHNMLTG